MRTGFHQSLAFKRASPLWDGLTIGLYGGSFNPAHMGHLHVSLEALKRLKLDAVWWLVTPGNPLKRRDHVAPLEARMAQARAIAAHPRLYVSDVETALGTQFSVETIERLCRLHPKTRFVWLMGADNLVSFHRWRRWREIMMMVPVAVLARPGYSRRALASPAARIFAKMRVGENRLKRLVQKQPPCWAYISIPQHWANATALRLTAGGNWEQATLQAGTLRRLSDRAVTTKGVTVASEQHNVAS